MVDKNLLEKVGKLGLPLFEVEYDIDVNKTLSEVAESKDMRLWEGFPVLLANAIKGDFDYCAVEIQLKTEDDRSNFSLLFLMSVAFYKYIHLTFGRFNKLYKEPALKDKNKFKKFLQCFRENATFIIAQKQLDSQRIKKMFNDYFKEKPADIDRLTSTYDELSLEYALSQAFSPKQKELFLKKLRGEKLTRTEIEYFSRTVKKKIIALAHPELHKLAQRLLKKE